MRYVRYVDETFSGRKMHHASPKRRARAYMCSR